MHCIILYYNILYYTIHYNTVQYSIVQLFPVLYSTVLLPVYSTDTAESPLSLPVTCVVRTQPEDSNQS